MSCGPGRWVLALILGTSLPVLCPADPIDDAIRLLGERKQGSLRKAKEALEGLSSKERDERRTARIQVLQAIARMHDTVEVEETYRQIAEMERLRARKDLPDRIRALLLSHLAMGRIGMGAISKDGAPKAEQIPPICAEAEALYRKVLDQPGARQELLDFLEFQGQFLPIAAQGVDFGRASAPLERLIALGPPADKKAEAFRNLVRTYRSAGDHGGAIEACNRAMKEFRGTDDGARAMLELGSIHSELHRYDLALDVYRRVELEFAGSVHAAQARVAIKGIVDEVVSLNGPGRVTASEKASFRLSSTNAPRITMELHSVDLMACAREGRMIRVDPKDARPKELIKRWTIDLKNTGDHLSRETIVELPVKSEGNYLLSASGKTARSQCLVTIPSLDVALVPGPRRCWAIVVATKTGAPVEGASVLFEADEGVQGRRLRREGLTDRYGLASFDWAPDPAVTYNLWVVAARSGPAGQSGGTFGRLAQTGESNKVAPHVVCVHADRPDYRRGDTVRLRAAFRSLKADGYVFPGDRAVKVVVRSWAEGAPPVDERELKLDASGYATCEFALKRDAPGTYYDVEFKLLPSGGSVTRRQVFAIDE